MKKLKFFISISLTLLLMGCSASVTPTTSLRINTPTPFHYPTQKPKLTLSATQILDEPIFDPQTPFGQHGSLHVDGVHIKDNHDKVFQLRGVSTHGIQWYNKYTSLETFSELKNNFKINSIRLALYADEESMLPKNQDSYIKILEDAISNAISLGLYIIIDWHILADGNPLKNKDNANIFFKYFSTKYQNYPNIIFEICNEPNGSSANWDDSIKPYADNILSTIRVNSPNSLVIVGTPHWCQSPLSVVRNKIDDKNTVYAFHFYAGSHGHPLRQTLKKSIEKYKLPIIISEFGTCDSFGDGGVDIESSNEWLDYIDSANIGWFIWNLSDKNEGSSIPVPNSPASNWTDSDLIPNGLCIKKRFLNY